MLFWFYNELCGTPVAGIDLTAGTCKAIAAASVWKISFHRCSAIMAENYFYHFIHKQDDYLSNLLPIAFDFWLL